MGFEVGPFPLKYLILYSLCTEPAPLLFSPSRLLGSLAIWSIFQVSARYLQYSKNQGSGLLHVRNTHTPYRSKSYGDVLHEGITTAVPSGTQGGVVT